MKELVIISKKSKRIKNFEKYFAKIQNNKVLMSTAIYDNESKIGIVFNEIKDLRGEIYTPFKRCFIDYKREIFLRELGLKSNYIIEKFICINIDKEFKSIYNNFDFNDKIYIDSVFIFLTKELEYNWIKTIEILKDNSEIIFVDNKKNLIEFKDNKNKKNEK